MKSTTIRPIHPASDHEINVVATRMRQTLVEVLGEDRGTAMHTLDWLRDRVRFHLAPGRADFLAETDAGEITGHFIARVERDDAGETFGQGSTIFVAPEARGTGLARRLLDHAEKWMLARGMRRAQYFTATNHARLIGLFQSHGYEIVETQGEMVRLSKALTEPDRV